MKQQKIPKSILKKINSIVNFYKEELNYRKFQKVANVLHHLLSTDTRLLPLIHSTKFRVKDPEHLRLKLIRKAKEALANNKTFNINEKNLFSKIDDLAGVRLLHLHTTQMNEINTILLEIFREEKYRLIDGPIANTWDNENKSFFEKLSMKVNSSRNTMYTSVHYIVSAGNISETRCELQVRTLMEEVWGEVSHRINYPDPIDNVCCDEQIKVLARATSSCTRLVDSIFKSHSIHSRIHHARRNEN